MTTTISLPSIKISRTSLGGRVDPVTPISEDAESPVSDNEPTSRTWESKHDLVTIKIVFH